jgi:hypothetical protein
MDMDLVRKVADGVVACGFESWTIGEWRGERRRGTGTIHS